MKKYLALTLATALCGTAAPALAQSAGDWTVGVGFGYVMPKDDNGSLASGALDADVGDNGQATITFEYFIRDNIGIEVLAATPFQHNIAIDGLGTVGSTSHLPPTVSVQYHFDTGTAFKPFAGIGVNYTKFFNVDAEGALAGNDLDLSDSFGVALHAGADYKISERGSIRADLRWMDIDTDVELNGTDIGKVEIDPWIFGVSYVHRF